MVSKAGTFSRFSKIKLGSKWSFESSTTYRLRRLMTYTVGRFLTYDYLIVCIWVEHVLELRVPSASRPKLRSYPVLVSTSQASKTFP